MMFGWVEREGDWTDNQLKVNIDFDGHRGVARGIMLENSNHNLSSDDGDKEKFVEALGELLMVE